MTDRSNESLFTLIRSLPELFTNLIKAEIEQLKTKAVHMGKYAGIGAGLFVGALIFLYFAIGVLVAVGILALALVMPAWLAALIVFVVFLLIAVVLALVGVAFFKKMGQDPDPVESIKQDIDAVKGMGTYDR
ncbi:Putative Holin-X, holin superfamily III [Paramicrobacterium humi]|uniref:Putative Holin-X, holin superfamily III n=1 Tax=Paramicrobacterium humi TaxID=640635 RepID=A0A1H4JX18_9MICO|nr:phage holin family protein [Microbacterium humi]SEB50192.1 Putative Holin-X, holin superfamily III [Microbacterium humi]